MDVLGVLKEISENIANNSNEKIALYSLIISILALVITIIFNMIIHRQYIRSLDPLLSFKLIKGEYFENITGEHIPVLEEECYKNLEGHER